VFFGEYGFFIWSTNAGPYRYWATLTSIVGHGDRYIRTEIGCKWGEISGDVLCRPAIMEHCARGMNSKHEELSLVHITQAYKIIALTPLF